MESTEFDYGKPSLVRAVKSLTGSEYRGVPGVREFRGEVVGPSDPVLYIGTHTHGNELGSAAIVPALLAGQLELKRGRVIVAVNNLAAAVKGICREPGDKDFNRLPEDDILSAIHASNSSAAVQRMRALARGGLLEATHGLDTHTIPKTTLTGFKLGEKGPDAFAGAIGIRDYIVGITDNQFDIDNPTGPKTVAFGNYIGGLKNPIPVAEIEGGGKETPRVRETVVRGTLSVMAQLGMIDPARYGLDWQEMEQRLYRIAAWHWAPAGYSLARKFKPYGRIRKGEPMMVDPSGQGEPVLAEQDGHMIMLPAFGKPSSNDGRGAPITDAEDWWVSDPVEISTQQVL